MRILIGLLAGLGLAGCTKPDSDSEIVLMYKLTFSGVGYEDLNDKKVDVVVEDSDDASVIGRQNATIAGGTFQLTFEDIPAGDYILYWYADLSGDGACQSPPADHAYSHSFTVSTTDVIYEHPHDTLFDSAACSHLQ